MNLIRMATRRRVTIMMLTVAALLFGLVSLSRLDVSLLPELSYPSLTVRTDFTGAAPAEIENLVTRPIEEVVGVVRGVREVRSVSRPGQSDVTLSFAWGTQMDHAALDVRERLERLNLPQQVDRPLLLRLDPSTEPVLRFALARNTGAEPDTDGRVLPPVDAGRAEDELRALRRFADERLRKDMESIEGVAAITISGGLEDEIQVLLDPQRLSQLGLSAEIVAQRLRTENVNLSGGRLEEGSRQFLVRTINEFRNIEQIAGVIIAHADGRPVYLRDVAEVREGWREREAVTRINGQEMVELAIYREGDANVVSVARQLERRLAGLRAGLPPDVALTATYDQSVFIRSAINQVLQAALLGGLLAVAVLYLFLKNARATVVIALAIPVSVIASFAAMYGGGLTLNIMSLGGIALAIGLLVDNAIVVLESIAARREQGDSLIEAARNGAGEVSGAVVAATLTTIAVFLPLVFVDGIAGQLFRDQALTVTFALLVSLAVALTLIPMLASLGEKPRARASGDLPAGEVSNPPGRGRFAALRRLLGGAITFVAVWLTLIASTLAGLVSATLGALLRPVVNGFNRLYDSLAQRYPGWLRMALARRGLTLSLALALFLSALALVPRLGMELVPSMAQGEFQVELRLAPGTPLERTDAVLAQLDTHARSLSGVARTDTVAGSGTRMDSNPEEAGEHTGILNVILAPDVAEDAVIDSLRAWLADQPGLDYSITRPALFSFSTPLEIEVTGYDLAQLREVSDRLAARLAESERLSDIRTSLEQGHPEIQIHFDHERAARLGLRADQIADTVVRQIRGEVATRYSSRERRIDVLVRASESERDSLERIAQLVVNPGSERPVTLAAVADLSLAIGPSEIHRIGQRRVALISANPGFGDLGRASEEARALIAGVALPSEVSVRVGGQSEEMQLAFRSLMMALALAVFLVYLVMASQFESLLHPFIILFTIPLAMTGAILALWLTGMSLSVVVFIGLIMLTGIVVNNAIVLVARINQLREQGLARVEAIIEGGRVRLRPIIMTTLTTTLGLLPLALGLGEGAEMRAPMAVTVIGGLLLATGLTLLVIPVVYSLLDRRQTEADLSAEESAQAILETAAEPAT